MPIIRPNAIRIKRFRELKEDLRIRRDRLLVGIDIAKAQHVAQVRLAHTRILDKQLGIPNTWDGFAAFWAHLQHRQTETGAAAIVCAVEPTGTYHEALAQFLEGHEVDVVLVSNHVAALNRRTLDGTWARVIPRMPTTSVTSWSGGTCSSTRARTHPSRPSAASCGCSATPGRTGPRARPASATRSSRRSGRRVRRSPRPWSPPYRRPCSGSARARRPQGRRADAAPGARPPRLCTPRRPASSRPPWRSS